MATSDYSSYSDTSRKQGWTTASSLSTPPSYAGVELVDLQRQHENLVELINLNPTTRLHESVPLVFDNVRDLTHEIKELRKYKELFFGSASSFRVEDWMKFYREDIELRDEHCCIPQRTKRRKEQSQAVIAVCLSLISLIAFGAINAADRKDERENPENLWKLEVFFGCLTLPIFYVMFAETRLFRQLSRVAVDEERYDAIVSRAIQNRRLLRSIIGVGLPGEFREGAQAAHECEQLISSDIQTLHKSFKESTGGMLNKIQLDSRWDDLIGRFEEYNRLCDRIQFPGTITKYNGLLNTARHQTV